MNLEKKLGLITPEVSVAFDIPRDHVSLLGFLNSNMLGLEKSSQMAGDTIWDLETATLKQILPKRIYSYFWNVENRGIVMEYLHLVGAVLWDLELTKPVFILPITQEPIVNPQPEKVYLLNEAITELHQVEGRWLVQNFTDKPFSDKAQTILYDFKTGEVVAKRKPHYNIRALDGKLIGQEFGGNKGYNDLLTGEHLFDAPPSFSGEIFNIDGRYVTIVQAKNINTLGNAYDLVSKKIIGPILPTDGNIEIIEGKPLAPNFEGNEYRDLFSGDLVFSIPLEGYLHLSNIDGKYFLESTKQEKGRTRIYNVTFKPTTIN